MPRPRHNPHERGLAGLEATHPGSHHTNGRTAAGPPRPRGGLSHPVTVPLRSHRRSSRRSCRRRATWPLEQASRAFAHQERAPARWRDLKGGVCDPAALCRARRRWHPRSRPDCRVAARRALHPSHQGRHRREAVGAQEFADRGPDHRARWRGRLPDRDPPRRRARLLLPVAVPPPPRAARVDSRGEDRLRVLARRAALRRRQAADRPDARPDHLGVLPRRGADDADARPADPRGHLDRGQPRRSSAGRGEAPRGVRRGPRRWRAARARAARARRGLARRADGRGGGLGSRPDRGHAGPRRQILPIASRASDYNMDPWPCEADGIPRLPDRR
jgi:hypothetical protein